jgi:hypothetical protein
MKKVALLCFGACALLLAGYLTPDVILLPKSDGSAVGILKFREKYANGTSSVNLRAPDALAANVDMVLPAALVGAGYSLYDAGSGALGWRLFMRKDVDESTGGKLGVGIVAVEQLHVLGKLKVQGNPFGSAGDTSELLLPDTSNRIKTVFGTGMVFDVAAMPAALTINSDGTAVMNSNWKVPIGNVTTPLKTEQFNYLLFDADAVIPAVFIPVAMHNRARAVHITEVVCSSSVGTDVINIGRDDGTPTSILSSNLTCNGTPTTSFVAGEDAIAVGHKISLTVVTGGVSQAIDVTVKYTID